jgi:hypothetical protein
MVCVKHRYVNSVNVTKEITLETITIPKSYLETTGLSYLSDVEQTVEFNIINLRYTSDLFIEVHETRDTVPVVTTVAVNKGDDATVEPLTHNPQKDVENDENLPEIKPEVNISDPEMDFSTIIYDSLSSDKALNYFQVSRRIYLDNEQFILQEYNERIDRIFVENSITNMVPNPAFLSTNGNIPTSWVMDAPGIIVNSSLIESELSDINRWQLRITNPNLFSAFNSVTLALDGSYPLLPGLNALTFSMYYRIKSTTSVIPFNSFKVRFKFFLDQNEIGSEQVTVTIGPDQNVWELLIATVQGSQININANRYLVDVDVADIDTTDLFNLELYLPQLEPTPFATTRTLESRIQDKYLSERFTLDLPFYMMTTTYHIIGPGLRGLFSSTESLKDGFEFQVSSDRLFFKQYNVTNAMILNVASSIFNMAEGEEVTYGVWVDGTVIEFYLNNTLVSSHSATTAIDQTKEFIVGSLERSNSTINSELLDFKVLRVRP